MGYSVSRVWNSRIQTSPARVKNPRIAPTTLRQTTRLTAGSESWEMARTRAVIIGTITNGF